MNEYDCKSIFIDQYSTIVDSRRWSFRNKFEVVALVLFRSRFSLPETHSRICAWTWQMILF